MMDDNNPLSQRERPAKPALSLVPSAPAVVPTPRRFRLNSLNGVQREMASVYRLVRTGQLESSEGSKLVYMLAQLGRVTLDANLEARVAELEKLGLPEGDRDEP